MDANGHDVVKTSVDIDALSTEQLVQVSQGLGHQIERLKEQRKWLNVRIAERLAAQQVPGPSPGDAAAAGATLDVSTRH